MKNNYEYFAKKAFLVKFTGFFIFILLVQPMLAAENSSKLSLSFRRNFGTALGNNISGDFTITGTGDADITSLELYFNDNMVAESDSNSLTFHFNTHDYPVGDTNITLIGYDGFGGKYQYSVVRNFLDPKIDTLILIGVILLILISVGLKILRYMRKQNAKKGESGGVDKSKIKIDIDNDLG